METKLIGYLNISLYGNPASDWLASLAGAALIFVCLEVFKRVVEARLSKTAPRTATWWDDALLRLSRKTKLLSLSFLSVYLSLHYLQFPPEVRTSINRVGSVVLLIQIWIWGAALIQFWVQKALIDRANDDGARTTTVKAVGFLAKVILFSIILLLGLDNFGVNVTTLVAGLGVGGIAVALAVQNILGDFLASLTLVLDKPFVIGDNITLGDFSGTIESIGLKTTRLKSGSGEELIIPNSDLLKSRIRNFKRYAERRNCMTLGVTYETPVDKLEAIPAIIEAIVKSKPKARFERAHFKTFSPSSLDFEVVYWISNCDQQTALDIGQAINLEIISRFEQAAISFAYPTQTLYVTETNSDSPGAS